MKASSDRQNVQEPADYRGIKVTVVGLGLFGGGTAAVRYYAQRGANVTVTDIRSAETLRDSVAELSDLTNVRLALGGHQRSDFENADIIILNPGVPETSDAMVWARASKAVIEREINIVMKSLTCPIIGVTGSNGKSTTTALIGEMIRGRHPNAPVGGNIGLSLLPILDRHPSNIPATIELSSFQLEGLAEIQRSPNISVVTNLTPNHLDRHGSFTNYAQAKYNILKYQTKSDVAVLNADDPLIRVWRYWARGRVMMYSTRQQIMDNGAYVSDNGIYIVSAGSARRLCDIDALNLPGEHNVSNALAAICAARASGVTDMAIIRALSSFGGLPHRLELVAESDSGVRYVNDSISTTPESTIVGVNAFRQPIYIILGGYDKKVDFGDMAAAISVSNVKKAYLIGSTAGVIEDALVQNGFNGEIIMAGTLTRAVESASNTAVPGSVILLSPGCASYDQFKNFTERGIIFRQLAGKMIAKDINRRLESFADVA